MLRIAQFVLRHKKLVLGFWILVLLAGVPNLGKATKAFSQEFSVPGREGFTTNDALRKLYGIDFQSEPIVVVTTLPAGATVNAPGLKAAIARTEMIVAHTSPKGLVAGYGSTGDRAFVSKDGRSTFILAYLHVQKDRGFGGGALEAKAIRSALATQTLDGASWHVTGLDALADAGSSNNGQGPGVFLEAFIGGVGALAVLAFVFASFIAFVPIVMAIFAIVATFMVMWLITTFAQVSFIVTFLVALIGLGVCIDYALLLVMRWREERANGLENVAAVERAMATAGSAVVFSGTTVSIGLLSLVVLPVPFLRSVGYAGMLIPVVSVAVAITLLPVILATVGPRLDWPRFRHEGHASRFWTRWGQLTVRHRYVTALAGLAVIVALAVAATQIQLGSPKADTLSASGDAHDGLVALEQAGLGSGTLTPFAVLVNDPLQVPAARSALSSVDGVSAVAAPAAWTAGGTRLLTVFPTQDGDSAWGRSLDSRLKRAAHGNAATVGGTPGQSADFVSAVYGNFPLMIALVSILTLVLLARAFRSILLPLKAVVLNLLSVAAAWGVLVLVWQKGYGSDLIWGIPATNAITEFIPLMVFAFLFGLSMDYEVFILSRVREEYDEHGSTDAAVITGIGRTGRLVTSAALILFLAFAALGSGPETVIKIFATGLGAGIILDATVVRALIVPALVSLFGRWNWWLPAPVARVLRVKPSAAANERT